jgi:hypothetical protein
VKLIVRAEDRSGAWHYLPVEWDMIPVCALYANIWVRNTGPTFLWWGGGNDGGIVRWGGLLALRWTFNGWGRKNGQVGKDRVIGG